MTTLTAETPVAAPAEPLGLWSKSVGAMTVVGAAIRVAAAVRAHRTPAAADLERLGINPADMPKAY